MSSHAKRHGLSLQSVKHLSRKSLFVIFGSLLVVALIVCAGITTSFFYSQSKVAASPSETTYSATALSHSQAASRGTARSLQGAGITGDTSYITVVIDGQSQLVFGDDFTTVRSVLEQGGITLDSADTITPSLDSKVSESTVITICGQDSSVVTTEQSIPFNTIKKESATLAKGQTKVETKGVAGVMEETNIITKSNEKTVGTHAISSWVKVAPVNQVELIGTASISQSSSNGNAGNSANYGTTMPVGDAQALAHSKVIARGWDEGQFTCLVQLWQRESGWRVTAHNPSGAYGIPQALPGSKMGAGWQTDANVQITWGINYIAGRYSTPCGALGYSNAHGYY